MLRMTNTSANTVATAYLYDMFTLSCLEPMGNFYHTVKSFDDKIRDVINIRRF